ncbi:lyase family protein [Nonomuraea turcica]|uniref:lyase family protein n=1 Tax=Nonomuraea sp. G32 TaxID=3067274 RepID=UPI00273C1811|nr:lyase family protein [Nonomuraea sp. G32]MDP4511395.1 lyase family protein [Nonomuraea sp. G32]
MADRLGHPVQHERQRCDLQPGDPARRRQAGRQGTHPSERPRQHGAVLQRHLHHRHASGRPAHWSLTLLTRSAESLLRRASTPLAASGSLLLAIDERLLPAAGRLHDAASRNSRRWEHVVKIGRTHLEDATPLTVGQGWSGYAAQLQDAIEHLTATRSGLYRLAIGGTAVGTGLNAPPGFADEVAAKLAGLTGHPFVSASNKFAAQASCDALVRVSSAVRALAVTLFKFANDMRWLGSGPRTGLHELRLPSYEPGSSIMPGKVNPTQAEAMLMVALQVMGNDTAVSMARAEGNFELNAFRPIIINNVLHSVRILTDMMDHFRVYLVDGVELDEETLQRNIERSIMMVTALSPVIGYDHAARIAHHALDDGLTLKQAALDSGVSETLFDQVVDPERLTRPGAAGSASGTPAARRK